MTEIGKTKDSASFSQEEPETLVKAKTPGAGRRKKKAVAKKKRAAKKAAKKRTANKKTAKKNTIKKKAGATRKKTARRASKKKVTASRAVGTAVTVTPDQASSAVLESPEDSIEGLDGEPVVVPPQIEDVLTRIRSEIEAVDVQAPAMPVPEPSGSESLASAGAQSTVAGGTPETQSLSPAPGGMPAGEQTGEAAAPLHSAGLSARLLGGWRLPALIVLILICLVGLWLIRSPAGVEAPPTAPATNVPEPAATLAPVQRNLASQTAGGDTSVEPPAPKTEAVVAVKTEPQQSPVTTSAAGDPALSKKPPPAANPVEEKPAPATGRQTTHQPASPGAYRPNRSQSGYGYPYGGYYRR